ncbi:hypothetical protein NCTGTJJY_CDS0282 [Serratia phage 92A1]|nr:hypothetical protein NCTGTJJY_CDS0282 [Serratia phage 92A1]
MHFLNFKKVQNKVFTTLIGHVTIDLSAKELKTKT